MLVGVLGWTASADAPWAVVDVASPPAADGEASSLGDGTFSFDISKTSDSFELEFEGFQINDGERWSRVCTMM